MSTTTTKTALWWRSLLWVLALVLMFAAAVYQRRTGPTYPKKGSVEVEGSSISYELIRSSELKKTDDSARVEVPDPGRDVASGGLLHYKRLRTSDPFTSLPLEREAREGKNWLVGRLPAQPPAGKLEYFIELQSRSGETVRIPEQGNVIIRFKGFVPRYFLWPHVVMMIFSVLIGMRAGLGALFGPYRMRLWAWMTLGGMTLGGMALGPLVQKHAFGAYWTGFPFGGDWTDNKMLVMWLAWVFACAVIGFKPKAKEAIARGAVVLAAIAMTGAFMIPHSMGGSELDYSKIDQGIDPAQAIETGRQ